MYQLGRLFDAVLFDMDGTLLDASAPTTAATALPGAVSVLRALRVPWAVITAAQRSVARRRLAAAGLPAPTVVIGERAQRDTPHPEDYLAAAAKLEVRPCDCLVFASTPAGVSSARRAGMSVIALAAEHLAGRLFADAVIDDYSTLLPHAWCGEPVGGYRRLVAEQLAAVATAEIAAVATVEIAAAATAEIAAASRRLRASA